MATPMSIAVDYSVIDHLHRIQTGSGGVSHREALTRLYDAAVGGQVQLWGAEITFVEMIQGVNKLDDSDVRRAAVEAKDAAKRALMTAMGIRILAYPCGKYDDEYSLCDLSLRCAGDCWDEANALEERLRCIRGIDQGDARQLVSCAYPSEADVDRPEVHPKLDWFVAVDRKMIAAVHREIAAQRLPELAHIRFGFVTDFAAALEAAAA